MNSVQTSAPNVTIRNTVPPMVAAETGARMRGPTPRWSNPNQSVQMQNLMAGQNPQTLQGANQMQSAGQLAPHNQLQQPIQNQMQQQQQLQQNLVQNPNQNQIQQVPGQPNVLPPQQQQGIRQFGPGLVNPLNQAQSIAHTFLDNLLSPISLFSMMNF